MKRRVNKASLSCYRKWKFFCSGFLFISMQLHCPASGNEALWLQDNTGLQAKFFFQSNQSIEHDGTSRPVDLSVLEPSIYVHKNCMFSHRPFHFNREVGFKFSFCSNSSETFREFEDNQFLSNMIRSGSFRKIHSSLIHFEVKTVSKFQKEDIDKYSHFYYSNEPIIKPEQNPSIEWIAIPSRFETAGFFAATSEDKITIGYQFSTTTNRLFLFHFLSDEVVQQCRSQLETIAARATEFINSLNTIKPHITEMYIRPDGFIEFSTEQIPGKIEIEIIDQKTGETYIKRTYPLFSYSSRTVRLPGTLSRIRNLQVLNHTINLSNTRLSSNHYRSRNKSLEWTEFCLFAKPCSNPGYHPQLLAESHSEDNQFCKSEEISLSEYNPFGIYENGIKKINGKFIELLSVRSCVWNGYLHSDSIVVDPGRIELQKGKPFVITVSNEYYSKPHLIRTAIRLLGVNDPLVFEPGGRMLFEPEPDAVYLPGFEFSTLQYSMILEASGAVFHEHSCQGLRPDICKNHAMSPGTLSSRNAQTYNRYAISEILPGGSVQSGERFRTDEFIELFVNGSKKQNINKLTVQRHTDSKSFIFIFPSHNSSSERIIISNRANGCIIKHEPIALIRSSHVYFPDSQATYRLEDESITLTKSLLNRAKDRNHSSLTVIRPSEFSNKPVPVLQRRQTGLCSGPSSADYDDLPGPALIVSDRCGFPVCLIALSENSISIQSRTTNTTEQFYLNSSISCYPFFHNHLNRYESEACTSEEECMDFETTENPDCTIETISPSNGYDWVRICANTTLDVSNLLVADSLFSDELIAYPELLPDSLSASIVNSQVIHKGQCALILDKRHEGDGIVLRPEDTAIWTVANGNAIGNGLSNTDTIRILNKNDQRIMCSYGFLNGSPVENRHNASGGIISRIPGTCRDIQTSFEVIR